jgi:hypothetical protein
VKSKLIQLSQGNNALQSLPPSQGRGYRAGKGDTKNDKEKNVKTVTEKGR